MGWKRRLFDVLDRRGSRFVLAVAGTTFMSLRAGQFCPVYFSGAWIHKFRSATLVEPEIILPTHLELETACIDTWTYKYKPAPGDIILEVGAGTGWDTLYFSRHVGRAGKVVAIEAHPETFECLRRMCMLNGLENVILLNCAVTSHESAVYISDSIAYHANTILGKNGKIRIKGRTLDSVTADLQLARIDFMKMNIEGAERLALAGMSETVSRAARVCISCHDFLADQGFGEAMRTKTETRAFLISQGFRVEERCSHPRPHVRDTLYGVNQTDSGAATVRDSCPLAAG